ncbi:MAG: hypothetical protein QF454_01065 [Candidatus Thalassarchaeaceae archaeon]|nr:hypothetical protein [Candidatus Thalassarchaeaceae archaeon]
MTEESESNLPFELKPVEFRGRVWAVSEWVPILCFVIIVFNGMLSSLFCGLIELVLLLGLIGYLQSRDESPISGQDPNQFTESGDVSESKLPSKAEAAEWAKKNSEYFMAWNKRQYKASKTWFGQKREDWAEWKHQRKMARYQIIAMPDQGVMTAVEQVMDSTGDALEDDAMAKMLEVDPELETAEENPEETETQMIAIPSAPTFTSAQKTESPPREPMVDSDRVPGYLRKATRIFYSLLISFYALAMLNSAYEMGLFDFFYSDFVVERLVGEYPGTQVGLKFRALILTTLFLCTSLLMLIGYRPFVTMLILSTTLGLSILLRLDFSDPIGDGSAHLVKDIAWSLLFLVFCSLTFFAKNPDEDYDQVIGNIPQELISASSKQGSGGNMDMTMPIKPKRPHRRARPLLFYEGFFLLFATALWPTALFCLAALASADLRADYGLPGDFNSGAMSGQMFLGILFFLALVSTYIVYKYDREARDDPMYAKEKAHYVEAMEHWININNDYYERAHARLTADLPSKSDEE